MKCMLHLKLHKHSIQLPGPEEARRQYILRLCSPSYGCYLCITWNVFSSMVVLCENLHGLLSKNSIICFWFLWRRAEQSYLNRPSLLLALLKLFEVLNLSCLLWPWRRNTQNRAQQFRIYPLTGPMCISDASDLLHGMTVWLSCCFSWSL